jgi:hypothetical protein
MRQHFDKETGFGFVEDHNEIAVTSIHSPVRVFIEFIGSRASFVCDTGDNTPTQFLEQVCTRREALAQAILTVSPSANLNHLLSVWCCRE